MCMLAIMPARMKSAPAMVSSHPTVLRPLKKRIPTPNSSGMRVTPKLLAPQKLQYDPTTVTWLEMRYPPTQVMMKPMRNSPSPPGVPPTSLRDRLFMPGKDSRGDKELRKKPFFIMYIRFFFLKGVDFTQIRVYR